MSDVVEKIKWAMSLREPQVEALTCLDNISSVLEYKTCSKQEAEKIASENCLEPHKISVDSEFDFPSFCFDMTTDKIVIGGCAAFALRQNVVNIPPKFAIAVVISPFRHYTSSKISSL